MLLRMVDLSHSFDDKLAMIISSCFSLRLNLYVVFDGFWHLWGT